MYLLKVTHVQCFDTYRALCSGIVNFDIGAKNDPFDAHIEVLCEVSPYFDKLFADRRTTAESVEGVKFYSDIDAEPFAEFLAWAYRGAIFEDVFSPSWLDLFRVWELAVKFEAKPLQKLVLVQCGSKYLTFDGVVDIPAVQYVYANFAKGNPLRRMAVDIWAERATAGKMGEYIEAGAPKEFLADLCLELVGKGGDRSPLSWRKGPRWHVRFEEKYKLPVGPVTVSETKSKKNRRIVPVLDKPELPPRKVAEADKVNEKDRSPSPSTEHAKSGNDSSLGTCTPATEGGDSVVAEAI